MPNQRERRIRRYGVPRRHRGERTSEASRRGTQREEQVLERLRPREDWNVVDVRYWGDDAVDFAIEFPTRALVELEVKDTQREAMKMLTTAMRRRPDNERD